MKARGVAFGRQVFQVDPVAGSQTLRCPEVLRLGPPTLHSRTQGTTECFHQHIACICHRERQGRGFRCPAAHVDSVRYHGGHPVQVFRMVNPQAHALTTFCQIGAQAPAHAQVTVVVDDVAEYVPAQAQG